MLSLISVHFNAINKCNGFIALIFETFWFLCNNTKLHQDGIHRSSSRKH